MSELDVLRQVVDERRRAVERADREVNTAVMRAYRARRDDGTPVFTLTEIGRAMGVSRQRVYQLVREIAAQEAAASAGTRTGTAEA